MTGTPFSGIAAYFHDFRSKPERPASHPRTAESKTLVCGHCGAVYRENHWSWGSRPSNPSETVCPACLRVRDRLPAGILTIRGDCLTENKREVINLIRDKVKKIAKQYPLKRIIDMEDDDTEAVIAFTDEQLTREVGDALHKAYDGVLDFQYSKDDNLLRVIWQR